MRPTTIGYMIIAGAFPSLSRNSIPTNIEKIKTANPLNKMSSANSPLMVNLFTQKHLFSVGDDFSQKPKNRKNPLWVTETSQNLELIPAEFAVIGETKDFLGLRM
jgi:hypothetical protein